MKTFDLFRISADGKPIWLTAVETLEEAKTEAKIVHVLDRDCDFCVLDQNTGAVLTIARKELG